MTITQNKVIVNHGQSFNQHGESFGSPQILKGNIMYYFKLVLTLCSCLVLAGSGAAIMYHMPNIIGLSAGLFFIGVGLYLFDLNEREHQNER